MPVWPDTGRKPPLPDNRRGTEGRHPNFGRELVTVRTEDQAVEVVEKVVNWVYRRAWSGRASTGSRMTSSSGHSGATSPQASRKILHPRNRKQDGHGVPPVLSGIPGRGGLLTGDFHPGAAIFRELMTVAGTVPFVCIVIAFDSGCIADERIEMHGRLHQGLPFKRSFDAPLHYLLLGGRVYPRPRRIPVVVHTIRAPAVMDTMLVAQSTEIRSFFSSRCSSRLFI